MNFYPGWWFPVVNIAYCFIGWNQSKSTGIHGGAHPRSQRVTAFAHLICISLNNASSIMMTTPIFGLCSGHMLSPQRSRVQLFKSCAGANMIKPIPIIVMLCDLSEWCFLKIVQPPLLSSSPCRLKKSHVCTEALGTDPLSSIFMNCWLWFCYRFWRGFYPKSLQPEINPLVSPVEPASRTSPVEPAWKLRFIGGFKFICSARTMGNVFTVQIWIIYINIVACKMCQ